MIGMLQLYSATNSRECPAISTQVLGLDDSLMTPASLPLCEKLLKTCPDLEELSLVGNKCMSKYDLLKLMSHLKGVVVKADRVTRDLLLQSVGYE